MRAFVWLTVVLLAPGCIVFNDHIGAPVTERMHDAIEVGVSTRDDVLYVAGAPTGTYGTNLLNVVTQVGSTFDQPITPGRMQPDIYVWQEVDAKARFAFFPILFFWSKATLTSRTLMVVFDEDGVVQDKGYREDIR